MEWFLSETQDNLTADEKVMAKRWTELKPHLLQAVNQTESEVLFMDSFSKQTYPTSKSKENIPVILPWVSTLGLLEPLEESYYFNGVRSLASPRGLQNAVNLVEKLMQENGCNHDQVLFNYYPEVLVALQGSTDPEDSNEKDVIYYKNTFKLTDKDRAENFLYNDQDFEIDQWDETTKKLTWIGGLQSYSDSEVNGNVMLGKVLATIDVKNNRLTFTTPDLAVTNQFLQKLSLIEGSLRLIDEQKEQTKIPVHTEIKQTAIKLDKDVPQYFGLYAQNDLITNLNQATPTFTNRSIRELVECGDKGLAEVWLKQSEYQMYKLVLEQYGKVEITADFNTARKELGLDLSPFVTGGDDRKSSVMSITPTRQRETIILEADIPIYEYLGFSPETINNFYTEDFLAFYKEKALGKSEATERKYRNSLYDIREVLENSSVVSWDDCDLLFWESLLAKDFFELNMDVSKAMVKDLLSTVNGLIKWLSKQKKLKNTNQVAELVKHYQPRMLQAVQLLDSINPYQARAYHSEMSEVGSLLRQVDKGMRLTQSGEFQIQSINKRSIRTMNTDTSEELTLFLDERAFQYAEEGMVLAAKIGKTESSKVWEIVQLERVSIGLSNN